MFLIRCKEVSLLLADLASLGTARLGRNEGSGVGIDEDGDGRVFVAGACDDGEVLVVVDEERGGVEMGEEMKDRTVKYLYVRRVYV